MSSLSSVISPTSQSEDLELMKPKMGSEAPDPKTFASWEEAFQYPIPAVRGMEKQLRREIESNREKLRTLVG